jgi:hypothetical protein
MDPKIISNDSEYWEARRRVDELRDRQARSGAESDELELWDLLVARYEKGRLNPPTTALTEFANFLLKPTGAWHRKPLSWDPWLSRETFVFFVCAAVFLYLRLMYQVSYFPAFFEGEEVQCLTLAKDTSDCAALLDSWWRAFKGGIIEYNKGYFWALVPFYLTFGYDVRVITYVIPAIVSLFCAAFVTLYRKAYPRGSLLSFVLALLFSVLCVAIRRYKWHTVAYLPAISVYLYFLPTYYSGPFFLGDRMRKALCGFLFILSFYLYFGTFLYAPLFIALVFFFSTRLQRRREMLIGLAGLVVFGALFSYVYYTTETWRTRIGQEIGSIRIGFTARGLELRGYSLKEFLYEIQLSTPYLVLWLVGLVAAFVKARRGDRFALITLTLFLPLFLFQMAISGLNNPDQLNWHMIPFLGIILIGADSILVPIRDRMRYGMAICFVLVSAVVWNEMNHYYTLSRDAGYQSFIQPRNTRTELSLVMRTIRDDKSGTVQYYLPAASVPESSGGFDYDVANLRLDFVDTFTRVVFFISEDDLHHKIQNLKGRTKAVAFLSVGYPPDGQPDTLKETLLGQTPEIFHPYEDIYRIPFLVRRFEFVPGAVESPKS